MSFRDSIAAVRDALGGGAKFAVTQILNVCLPGSGAVVELVGKLLDLPDDWSKDVKDAAKDFADARWKADIARRVGATEEELEKAAGLLDTLRRDMTELVEDVARRRLQADDIRKLIDEHPEWRRGRDALREVAARVEKLEGQHDRWRAAGLNTNWIRDRTTEHPSGPPVATDPTDDRRPPPSSPRSPVEGDTLGGWRLGRLVGGGGMGRVFRATKDGRDCAVKVLRPELSADEQFVRAFKREMEAMIVLKRHRHPSRVSMEEFDFCRDFGCWYLVMPYIDGTHLEEYLKQHGALSAVAARTLFAGVAGGLVAAHEQGVHHRDIKPQNIVVMAGGVGVLVDFGIAGLAGVPGHTTAEGFSGEFAAPEHIRSGVADARGDVYALAATMYYALNYGDEKARNPIRFKPDRVPDEFRSLLTDALANDPDERPQTAAAFLERLSGSKVKPPPPKKKVVGPVDPKVVGPVDPPVELTWDQWVGRITVGILLLLLVNSCRM